MDRLIANLVLFLLFFVAGPAAAQPYLDYHLRALPPPRGPDWLASMPKPGETIRKGAGRQQLRDAAGGNRLAAGRDDDEYVVIDPSTRVEEAPGGGLDTIITFVSYTAPRWIEVLRLAGDNLTGQPSRRGGLVIAERRGATLVSGPGDDVLVDKSGARTIFAFSPHGGRDVVYGFDASDGPSHDFIQLRGFDFTTFKQVRAHLSQAGPHTRLTLPGGGRVLLRDTRVEMLTEDHFLLELDRTQLVQTFADEFDRLDLYDTLKQTGVWRTTFAWGPENGPGSNWSRNLPNNGEQQLYVESAATGRGPTPLGLNPFSVRDGVLTITATRTPPALRAEAFNLPFISGMINSRGRFAQKGGYFELRAQLPAGKGMFPAFWMMADNDVWPPEIDVFENVGTSTVFHGFATGIAAFKPLVPFVTESSPSIGFHTYGVLWTERTLTWYLDGMAVARTATPPDMTRPMYPIVNLAVGGHWAGAPDDSFQAGAMRLDHLRIYTIRGATRDR